jgi:hypothetical protein
LGATVTARVLAQEQGWRELLLQALRPVSPLALLEPVPEQLEIPLLEQGRPALQEPEPVQWQGLQLQEQVRQE